MISWSMQKLIKIHSNNKIDITVNTILKNELQIEYKWISTQKQSQVIKLWFFFKFCNLELQFYEFSFQCRILKENGINATKIIQFRKLKKYITAWHFKSQLNNYILSLIILTSKKGSIISQRCRCIFVCT